MHAFEYEYAALCASGGQYIGSASGGESNARIGVWCLFERATILCVRGVAQVEHSTCGVNSARYKANANTIRIR